MLCPNCKTELIRTDRIFFCPKCSGLNLEAAKNIQVLKIRGKCSNCGKDGIFEYT